MKKAPSIMNVEDVLENENEMQGDDGEYYPARPIGCFGVSYRFKAAWLVFVGKADAVLWPCGQ